MKKNVKIMSLLAFGFVVAGALSLNVSNTQGDVTAYSNIPTENEFIMDVGASVRIPNVANSDVTTNDNGIRFTGLVGATLAESGVEEAGTFILPLNYWDRIGEISEATCFGESAVYTWTGDENAEEKENAKQIIHVAGTLYKENANDTFYVVKGSALHIKDDNLDVDYIGCSYLKLATGDYVFAETDANNARSVVEVAQKALLNAENDEAFLDSAGEAVDGEKVTAVDNAYTKRWIEKENPYVEVKVKSVKPISSTQNQESEETLSVPFTAYNCTTTADGAADEIENYAYAKGATVAQTVMIDGSTVVTHNYNYTPNRVTLFDGDSVPFDSETMTAYYTEPVFVNGDGWTYEGNGSIRTGGVSDWSGFVWTNGFKLPFKTNTFTLAAFVTDTNGALATYVNWTVWMKYTNATGAVEEKAVTIVGGRNLKAGYNAVTLTLPEDATTDNVLYLALATDANRYVYVDNFCAEKDLYFKGAEVPEYYQTSLAITTDGLGSTTLFPEELPSEFSLQYKAKDSDTWTTMTKDENNTYAVSDETLATSYEFQAVYAETTVALGKAIQGFVWATFDEENPHYVMNKEKFSNGNVLSDSLIIDAKNSYKVHEGNCGYDRWESWIYLSHYAINSETGEMKIANLDLGFNVKRISFYMWVDEGTQDTTIANVLWFNSKLGYVSVQGKEVKGNYLYEINLTEEQSFSQLASMCFKKGYYVDTIVLYAE